MTTEGDEPYRFDWSELVPKVVHPTKVAIIEAMARERRPLSAHELEPLLGHEVALTLISYHLTKLAKLGVVEEVGSRQVRGATEHFYFFAEPSR